MDVSREAVVAERNRFRDELLGLEQQTIQGFDLVIAQLDRALQALTEQDVELAEMVVAADDLVDDCYRQVQEGVLSLLPRQARLADDWRLVVALLQIVRCIERIGDQCVNIATLIPLSGHDPAQDIIILDLIEQMGQAARRQLVHARKAFQTRHTSQARDLVRLDADVNRLNREIFQRGVDIGDNPEAREWAMFMTLVARCLERIGDNTVDIAEQTVFIVTGRFRDFHHGRSGDDQVPH